MHLFLDTRISHNRGEKYAVSNRIGDCRWKGWAGNRGGLYPERLSKPTKNTANPPPPLYPLFLVDILHGHLFFPFYQTGIYRLDGELFVFADTSSEN